MQPLWSVFGGTEVIVGKYPWMVYLYFTKPGRHSFCGGAIINYPYILTAAQCTHTAKHITRTHTHTKAQFLYKPNFKGTTDTLHDIEKIIQLGSFHLL
ncbi:trypsin-like protein, partial [Leptotrombidium deliense]